MKWLVTGATGAVVSEIVTRLLAAGDQVVVIVRDADGDATRASRRAQRYLGEHDGLRVLVGDVSRECCGLASETVQALRAERLDGFVHGAAELAYNGTETLSTNVLGTVHALSLAHALSVRHFVFLSTAYVAGSQRRFLENEVGSLSRAKNDYERSKIAAEALVRSLWPNPVILRISIMVGDSATGRIKDFNGYYGFLGSIAFFRRLVLPYRDAPIFLGVDEETGNGVDSSASLNLVPNDWGTDMIMLILDDLRSGGSRATELATFHITHPQPVSMGWLFETSFGTLDVPVSCTINVSHPDGKRRGLTKKVRKSTVDVFAHYVQTPFDFGANEHLRALPGYRPPPPVDEQVVRKLIDYALEVQFGRASASA
jgi:uncharacterized protein YbjT (DUF2867 family)